MFILLSFFFFSGSSMKQELLRSFRVACWILNAELNLMSLLLLCSVYLTVEVFLAMGKIKCENN